MSDEKLWEEKSFTSRNLQILYHQTSIQKKVRRSCTDWLGREFCRAGKDIQYVRVLKDENGNVMVSLEAVLKRWKEYFEKLMNEKNDRDPGTAKEKVINEEVNCVSIEEVKNSLRGMKKGLAVGPDELPIEVWKCMGGMEITFLTRMFNRLLVSKRMPERMEK